MKQKQHLSWLYEQLPDWVTTGLIDAGQAEKIRQHYGDADDYQPDYNTATIVISILGALLIGGGIILIVAYNWDNLPKSARVVLSFVPLLLAQLVFGYAFFRRRQSIAWAEGASVFLMLMLAASMALVSQTYHIWGEPTTFLRNWLLLSIPLLYLLNSSLCTVVYLIGTASWVMQMRGSESVLYWAMLAAALPHLIQNIRQTEQPVRRNVLGWALVATFIFGWFGVIEIQIEAFGAFGTALVFSTFYLLALQNDSPSRSNLVQRPFEVFAIAGGFVLLMIFTYDAYFDPFNLPQLLFGAYYAPWAGSINFAVLSLLSIGASLLFIRYYKQVSLPGLLLVVLPVFIAVFIMVSRVLGPFAAMLLVNVYVLGWGIAWLIVGIRQARMGAVNLGMLVILVLATARFFDTDWSFIIKGVAFITLGLGFLAANWVLSRRIKLKSS